MKLLDECLEEYAESDYYPFHMPGHKRVPLCFKNPYEIDITEIEGFDCLHHADGILANAQQRLSKLCQSRKSYYLVNGSTCGILSAVGALTRAGDCIVMARNCHKAVYNAVKIFRLKVNYVYPKVMACGIQGNIDPNEVENALKMNQKTKVVIITSPTYDGIVSDIRKIADITHKYNAYLIVDEAHGAHFSLNAFFPESAVRQDADVVIQSLHKTLPSFTQTAALHLASDRADSRRIEEMLRIFQTSSPSYVLMAGMEKCVRLLEKSGKELFARYWEKLSGFYERCRRLKYLHVLTAADYDPCGFYDVDQSKLLISTLHAPIDGKALYDRLLNTYHLQLEMYSAEYVLAMTSIMDTQEGFDRLFGALVEIDEHFCEVEKKKCMEEFSFLKQAYAVREKVMEISDIDDYYIEETPLKDCAGKVCAGYISLYPPGIPIIVPGEVITNELIIFLEMCQTKNRNVQGLGKFFYCTTIKKNI